MKIVAFLCCLGLVSADSEPQREYILFEKVDHDLSGCLDRSEVDNIFLAFDVDHNQEVTRVEFENDWVTAYHLGNAREANLLFTKADTNGDGHLTHADMPLIYTYFDMNSDGCVDMNEFLTQWGDLKLAPVDVDIIDAGDTSSMAPPTTHANHGHHGR
ncbi:uncharacterized protein LOC134281608 [Saccostrea cucullata]|uniref:uncharacterized protein LOC134281608 n=1 Tax=Saccostrea cuccullata TaxID=36930 RepID=UPI002ED15EC3